MKNMYRIVFLISTLALLFINAYAMEPQLKTNAKAPEFTLVSVEGDTLRLSDFYGKVVILHFWKSN